MRAGYRTFNLLDIKMIQVVNYDWGKYDKIADRDARRKKIEAEARDRKEDNEALN